MPSAVWPAVLWRKWMGGDINALFSKFMKFNSFRLIGLEIASWSFHSMALSGAARGAKLKTNFWNTLRNPTKIEVW